MGKSMKLFESIKSWPLWSLFQKPEEPKPEEKAESTTDLSRSRARRAGALNQWIIQHMFRKTHADIKAVNLARETIAMDSAVAMDSS